MFRMKRERSFKGFRPLIMGLPRDPENQINIDIADPVSAGCPDRCLYISKCMDPAESIQKLWLQRLHSERQAVHTGLYSSRHPFFCNSTGIGFYGKLGWFIRFKDTEQGICEIKKKSRRKQGRGPAADKQGVDGFDEFVFPVFGFL